VTIEISKLLDVVIRERSSDLHLSVGRPPTIRMCGTLRPLQAKPLTAEDTVALMRSITSERYQQELQEEGGTDFGFTYNERARFRVSIFKQKGYVGVVLRLIPSDLMTFEEIGLPAVVKDLCLRPRGLALITGPTGSGKTTTLATMIDFVNREASSHIVTVEDPIEYYHDHRRSVVTQREVGVDVPSFAECLRRTLRADPDVILVGEMRDLETIQAAITAAETGHMVFATVHTTGAANTINRIVDAFPQEQQEQVRTQMADSLEAVISQVLIPTADGQGRVAAFEIMFNTDAIRNLIRESKTFRINSFIQTSGKLGMILLDDFMFGLWAQGRISFQEMVKRAQDPDALQQKVREYTKQHQRKK
jgi:twitching motility protein PilT